MILVTKDNKIIALKEKGGGGRILLSHNIPFTPVCEGFIDYDAKTHSFSRTRGYGSGSTAGELDCDFWIPLNLQDDFEISFIVKDKSFENYLFVSKQNSKQARGFHSYALYGEQVRAATQVDKAYPIIIRGFTRGDKTRKVLSKEYQKSFSSEQIFDKYWRIIRINGIVTLWIGDKVFYEYQEKFLDENLNFYGSMLYNGSEISHFSIKQL